VGGSTFAVRKARIILIVVGVVGDGDNGEGARKRQSTEMVGIGVCGRMEDSHKSKNKT
jgi:hypothetical protein